MAAKTSGMETLLECCICLEECKDPRLLPCAHSLCKQCLEKHIESSAQEGRYQCPACRHQCEVPAEGASGVPKNFFLNTLRDFLKGQTEQLEQSPPADVRQKSEQPECSNSHLKTFTHTSVTVFCVQCSAYLCSNCESCHEVFSGNNHDLQPIDEVAATGGQNVKPRRRKPKCDQHPALHNDMYCHKCHIPMCIQCCMVKHKQHEYCEIADLTEEQATKLAELTQRAEKRYTILDQHLKKLDAGQDQMDADANKACREIQQTADEFRDLVTERERALIKEIKDTHAVAATDLKAAHKETELNKANVQSLLSYIQALQASGDVSDQVVHTPGLLEQLRQQESSPLKSVSWTMDFKRNTEDKAQVNALLGSVSKVETVDRPVSLNDDKTVNQDSLLQTLEPNISNIAGGITKIDDCVCVVGWWQPHLWVHNLETNTSKQHTLTNLKAAGMTTVGSHSNTLVITDRNKKLHFITINPQNMNITKELTKSVSFVPHSVVYDPSTGRLIISNRGDKQIVICSKAGDVQDKITLKTDLYQPWCVLPTAGDAYIVLDQSDKSKIHLVNQSGDVTHTYKASARAGRSLHHPHSMLQDSQGRLLVADTDNNCIRLINNQEFSHDMITLSDYIQCPTCLYLDETAGTLYVGHQSGGHKINMYKWPVPSADTITKSFKLCVKLGRYK